MPRSIRCALAAIWFSLAAAACTSESPSGPNLDPTDPPRPTTPAILECEVEGYPCSFSEVTLEVLERSDALGDEALAMLEVGASTDEVARWLGEQSDVAEVDWDELAIRFRVEGGRGTWIFREGLFETRNTAIRPVAALRAPAPPAPHVVAAKSKDKRALVLSPFFWEVPELEDGETVAAILEGTRGYEDGVSFLANQEQTDLKVDLGSFSQWQGYQVIHISTHGKRQCNETRCRATIAAGLLDNLLPDGPSKAVQLQALEHFGLDVAKREKGPDYLILTADFFRYLYPQGLNDAVVFLTACQSFGPQATDLADALQGSNTVVLGWDEAVFVSDATATSVALYGLLAERGYPVEVAYEELGTLQTGHITKHSPNPPRLRLATRREGGDMRIRDVVYLLHPVTGAILTESHEVEIRGAMGDGQPDTVPFLVRVDGVKKKFAGEMSVHVSVDGVEAAPIPLTAGDKNDQDRWTVPGTILIPPDVDEEKEVVFRAWVDLHSGGESDHETPAFLIGGGPIMGWTWEFVGTVREYGATTTGGPIWRSPTTRTARLTLRFEDEQALNERNPRYVITAGTATYDFNHTTTSSDLTCTYTALLVTWNVMDWDTFISALTFDTTVDPVAYEALLFGNGPSFTYQVDCEDNEGERPDGYPKTEAAEPGGSFGAPVPAAGTVSEDRRAITGSDASTADLGAGRVWVTEYEWSITRLD